MIPQPFSSHRPAHPLQLTPLIGREYELLELDDLFHQPSVRLVTLVGPGGVGKTRLALQVAERLGSACRDGACLVPLDAIRDAALLLPTVANALGVSDTGSRSLHEELIEALQDRELLLVLDNFEHLTAAAPLIPELMVACPGLRVLITSRAPLGLHGEREYPLAPLPLPEAAQADPERYHQYTTYAAVRLFVERAMEVRPSFRLTPDNAADVVEICRRLDGLPLAIELAAARVKVLSPAALRQALTRRLQVLTGVSRGRSARFQTMRDTIEWSYDLLSAQQQRLFRRLAVFAGGFALEGATAVCADIEGALGEEPEIAGSDPFSLLDRITELIDRSLILQAQGDDPEPRFTMLQTIQEFGREQLAGCGEMHAAQRAHSAYVVGLAEQSERELTGANQIAWLDRLENEHDNIRAALAWAIGQGDARLAQRIAAPLWRFWSNRGHLAEGRQWFDQALALDGDEARPERAYALHGAGQMAEMLGDYEQASSLYREGMAAARAIGDRDLVARLFGAMANVAHDRGNYDESIQFHEEARTLYAETGNRRGLAISLHNLGNVRYNRGDLDGADSMYAQSLALMRELGDERNIGYNLGSLGTVALAKGDYERARQLQEESLRVMERIDDEISVAATLINLGNIHQELGDYAEAVRVTESALAVLDQLGAKRNAAIARYNLGHIARIQGDSIAATAHLAESLIAFWEFRDVSSSAECIEALGGEAIALGDPRRAARLLAAAAALRRSVGSVSEPSEEGQRERDLAAVRAALDATAFASAWDEGVDAPIETIIAEALGVRVLAASTPRDRLVDEVAARYGLSRREVQVLRLFATGRTSQEIAAELAIGAATVTQLVGRLHTQLGVDSRAGLAAIAFKHGLV